MTDGPSTSGKRQKLTTEEWRQMYERDGTVDLFLQDDFNAGVRMVVRAYNLVTVSITLGLSTMCYICVIWLQYLSRSSSVLCSHVSTGMRQIVL